MEEQKTFDDNINIVIQETKQERRGIELIADFVDDYAQGWFFAVGECFKNQLDIKLTERKEDVVVDGKVQREKYVNRNGKIKERNVKKSVLRWTQGNYFCFDEGHVLYDTPHAYKPIWKDALEHIKYRIEIIRATPNKIENGKFLPGHVTFRIDRSKRPVSNKLDPIGQYHLSQDNFVTFLKTGMIPIHVDKLQSEYND